MLEIELSFDNFFEQKQTWFDFCRYKCIAVGNVTLSWSFESL